MTFIAQNDLKLITTYFSTYMMLFYAILQQVIYFYKFLMRQN